MILLDVIINIFSKQELGHVLVNVRSCGWDWDDHVLLYLDVDPYVFGVVTLAPGITCQGLVGNSKLVSLGSCTQIIYVTLQVLG